MPPSITARIGAVLGDGPFVEVGSPTAIAVSERLVAVGGDLGWPQWNGRSVISRSDRSVGWFPVATYDRSDLRCRSFLTSKWEVNALAIHPAGEFLAIGTGSYDGGYLFEGELLLHHLATGETVSVLSSERCVESVAWTDEETLHMIIAPTDDDEVDDWDALEYQSYLIRTPHWSSLHRRSIQLDDWPFDVVSAPAAQRAEATQALTEIASEKAVSWVVRRQGWAIDARSKDIVLGLEGGIESWSEGAPAPRWRADVDGSCTQLLRDSPERLTAGVWESPSQNFLERPLAALSVSGATGGTAELFRPGFPAILLRREDGCLLFRNTEHRPAEERAAVILSPDGQVIAEVDVGPYDLFNHYFEVCGAKEFFLLVGERPQAHEDKWIVSVERTWSGRWRLKKLFPLAWTAGAHLFGGPGVWAEDAQGGGIIHAGAVHDGRGLLTGNAFVVRRRFPSGDLQWHVPLDNTVTAIDARDGAIVAVTNLSELFVIDALTGEVRASRRLSVEDRPVIPLSLTIAPGGNAWIGTLDGRAVEVSLDEVMS